MARLFGGIIIAAIVVHLLVKLTPLLIMGAVIMAVRAMARRGQQRRTTTPAPAPLVEDDPLRYLTPADIAWLYAHGMR